MDVVYLSPSDMPSRTANSVHVIRMVEAFCQNGSDVSLYVNRTVNENPENLHNLLEKYYGVKLPSVRIYSIKLWFKSAATLQLAIYSVISLTRYVFSKKCLVLSRNLYAAYILSFFMDARLIFETHQVEMGFRRHLQHRLLKKINVRSVVISEALREILSSYHSLKLTNCIVLHDAAPSGIQKLSKNEVYRIRKVNLGCIKKLDSMVVGYFGHLYHGRGVEIIEGLAKLNSDIDFYVFGGNTEQINDLREKYKSSNLHVMGYVEPAKVQTLMSSMDVVLMPYQKTVAIAQSNQDTARWMSPMKMFEYMAAHVPIISSRLPVLMEVLHENVNCLMAEPDDVDEWCAALNKIRSDSYLAEILASTAYSNYQEKYTWYARANAILRSVL